MANDNDIEAAMEQLFEQTHVNVSKYGWSAMGVFPDTNEHRPPFTYTIGLAMKGLPELVIYGIGNQPAHEMLCTAVEVVEAGVYDGMVAEQIANYPVCFRKLPQSEDVDNAFRQALNYYGWREKKDYEGHVDAYQIVWQDKNNKFPWEPGFDDGFDIYQNTLVRWNDSPPRRL